MSLMRARFACAALVAVVCILHAPRGWAEFDQVAGEKYFNRAVDALNSKDFKRALHNSNLAIQASPTPMAYLNRGIALKELDRLDDSVKDFTLALKYYPEFTEALLNRAILYGDMKRYDRSMEDFDAILRIEEKGIRERHADVQARLPGWVKKWGGNKPPSIWNENIEKARFFRAWHRVDQGDLAGAREDYQAILRMSKDDELKRDVQRYLNTPAFIKALKSAEEV